MLKERVNFSSFKVELHPLVGPEASQRNLIVIFPATHTLALKDKGPIQRCIVIMGVVDKRGLKHQASCACFAQSNRITLGASGGCGYDRVNVHSAPKRGRIGNAKMS